MSVSALDYGDASDEQLLLAARSGDERAFVELSSRYTASLHRKVFRILRNREDAEDAVQDALFKAYTHLGQFRSACKFSTWLTRIAINSALMQLRQRRSHSEVSFHQRQDDDQTLAPLDFPDPSPNAEQLYAKRQTIDRLAFEVQRLPSYYRTIVSHYHEQERNLQDAADSLGITVAAAKSRLSRARLAIRSALERKRISMADACF
jgi:RNA polymerase sigma-70 factor (ECF subfamily)